MHRKATCLRLLRYFREERWRVALLTFIVAVSVAAGVSAPVFMSQAIDAITPAGLSGNKQMVANLVKGRHFFILTQLYRLKNRI